MLKKKNRVRPVHDDMSFTIDPSVAPARTKVVKKKVKESRRESSEDQEAVNAAKDKLRRLKNKNRKSTRAPHSNEEAEVVERKKKRPLDADGNPIRTKTKVPKKVPGRDLVVPGTSMVKRMSKLDKKELVSIMGDDAEEMQQLFEDDNTDQAIRLLNRRLIQTCIDLIPQLETGIRNSKGRYGVHSLNGTIQTIRELVIDLQQMQDRGAIGESIVEKIIRPAFLEIATKIVEESATVLSEIKDTVEAGTYSTVRQAQIDSRNRLASVMNSKYEFMREETVRFLQR